MCNMYNRIFFCNHMCIYIYLHTCIFKIHMFVVYIYLHTYICFDNVSMNMNMNIYIYNAMVCLHNHLAIYGYWSPIGHIAWSRFCLPPRRRPCPNWQRPSWGAACGRTRPRCIAIWSGPQGDLQGSGRPPGQLYCSTGVEFVSKNMNIVI